MQEGTIDLNSVVLVFAEDVAEFCPTPLNRGLEGKTQVNLSEKQVIHTSKLKCPFDLKFVVAVTNMRAFRTGLKVVLSDAVVDYATGLVSPSLETIRDKGHTGMEFSAKTKRGNEVTIGFDYAHGRLVITSSSFTLLSVTS